MLLLLPGMPSSFFGAALALYFTPGALKAPPRSLAHGCGQEMIPPCYDALCRSVVFASAAPWTVAHQAPRSMGFPRQGYLSGVAFPSPGALPSPGTKPGSLAAPSLAVRSLTVSAPPRCGFSQFLSVLAALSSLLETSFPGVLKES